MGLYYWMGLSYMDLNNLLIFNEVVKRGSFTQAAKQLQMPSSNVSRKVQMLEAELGIKLLHRTTRAVMATAEGQNIYQLSQGLVDTKQSIHQWLSDQHDHPQGLINITAPESFSQWPLADWLIEFQTCYPDIKLNLISDSETLSFDDYKLDFAFRLGPLLDSQLIAKPLFSIQFGFFASQEFLSKQGRVSNVEQLLTLPAIACTKQSTVLPWLYKDQKSNQQHRILPSASFKVKDQAVALQAAEKGLGVVFLPEPCVQEQLKPILKKYWPEPITFYLLYRDKSSVQSKRCQVFIEFIEQRLASMEMVKGVSRT